MSTGLTEAFSGLSSANQGRITSVRREMESVQQAEDHLLTRKAKLAAEVHWAVSNGCPVRVLAMVLGVSTSRVYQIVEEYRTGR